MRLSSSAALPIWIAVLPLVGLVLGWWLAPDATARLAAKEGPLEHVSHVVLAVALLGWIVRAARHRGVAIAVALWSALVLAEELDWGAVYGVRAMADVWIELVGRPDLHNAWGGGSYVLFGLPIVVLIGLGVRGRGSVSPHDAAGLVVIVVGSVIGTLVSETIEPLLDEVSELSLYGVLAWMGWRTDADPRGATS